MNEYPVASELNASIGLDLSSSNEDESSIEDEKDLPFACAPQSTSVVSTNDACSLLHPITPECSQLDLRDFSLPSIKRRLLLPSTKVDDLGEPTVPTFKDDVKPSNASLFALVEKDVMQKSASRGLYSIVAGFLLLPVILGLYSGPQLQFPGDSSVYVPGAGFSGFWYTMGRLHSIGNPASNDFVCYSSGCLASVATLNNFTIDEMACVAFSIQRLWKTGVISRYEVVAQFVDSIVFKIAPSELDPLNCPAALGWDNTNAEVLPLVDPNLLARLHMLTTTKHGRYGVKAAMRTPSDLDELWQMLVQTTWIPAATGNALWNGGHMDGAFSLWQHPKCSISVSLPYDLDLFINSLNVNLGRDKLDRYWADGRAFGL